MLPNNNDWDRVKYIFADVEGNLNVCLTKPYKGDMFHSFRSNKELINIIEGSVFEEREGLYLGDCKYTYESFYTD